MVSGPPGLQEDLHRVAQPESLERREIIGGSGLHDAKYQRGALITGGDLHLGDVLANARGLHQRRELLGNVANRSSSISQRRRSAR